MATGAVMSLIMMSALWTSPEIKNRLVAAAWLAVILASVWGMYPGNWIASAPYAVEIVEGKGLRLYAFLKKIYIPLNDVVEINESFLRTRTVFKLRKRHGLLKSFWIHWAYGEQGRALVLEIRKEMARRG